MKTWHYYVFLVHFLAHLLFMIYNMDGIVLDYRLILEEYIIIIIIFILFFILLCISCPLTDFNCKKINKSWRPNCWHIIYLLKCAFLSVRPQSYRMLNIICKIKIINLTELYLHLKLWDLQQHFHRWVLRLGDEGKAKLSAQNPCLAVKVCSSWRTRTPTSASYQRNPKFCAHNWHLDQRQASNHLVLDIFLNMPQVQSAVLWVLCPSHPSGSAAGIPQRKGPEPRRVERMLRQSSAAAQPAGDEHLDLPLSKEHEGGGMLPGPRGITAPTCPTQIGQSERAGTFLHIAKKRHVKKRHALVAYCCFWPSWYTL